MVAYDEEFISSDNETITVKPAKNIA